MFLSRVQGVYTIALRDLCDLYDLLDLLDLYDLVDRHTLLNSLIRSVNSARTLLGSCILARTHANCH